MSFRVLCSVSFTAILLMVPAAAQTAVGVKPASAKAEKVFNPPRTADGKPDFNGLWSFQTLTPLERPADLAGKATFATDEEARAYAQRHPHISREEQDSRAAAGSDAAVGNYNEFWYDWGTPIGRQTSQIIDPPDGKFPAFTPAGEAKMKHMLEVSNSVPRGPEDRPLSERCILGYTAGPPMVSGAYNNNVQIFQSGNTVVLLTEMIHTARIIPTDGRPHGTVRQWLGDSRGRWEGNTLVVDTINFREEGTTFASIQSRVPQDVNFHLIERLTLTAPNVLTYEYTFEDPTTITRPFTSSIPMRRSSQPMYEYACHEGNYGMYGMMSGARAQDAAAEAAKPGSR